MIPLDVQMRVLSRSDLLTLIPTAVRSSFVTHQTSFIFPCHFSTSILANVLRTRHAYYGDCYALVLVDWSQTMCRVQRKQTFFYKMCGFRRRRRLQTHDPTTVWFPFFFPDAISEPFAAFSIEPVSARVVFSRWKYPSCTRRRISMRVCIRRTGDRLWLKRRCRCGV